MVLSIYNNTDQRWSTTLNQRCAKFSKKESSIHLQLTISNLPHISAQRNSPLFLKNNCTFSDVWLQLLCTLSLSHRDKVFLSK